MAAVPENIKRQIEIFASGVDKLVYQLYNLKEEDTKIVEDST
jgi:hypothetical protein